MAQLEDHLVAKGLAKGRVEGEARILLRQLAFKFGPVDTATRERVASATPDDLATWAERLLSAVTLAEVFAES